MPDSIFTALYSGSSSVTLSVFLIITCSALVLGLAYALLYRRTEHCTRSFALTLSLLPAVVSVVILMVSGSIGAGVAVAGTFSLVRFRSAPGSAKEIVSVFIAMAIGLACGMGFPLLAALFTLILCTVYALFSRLVFPENGEDEEEKTLSITIPEDLEYATIFDDIFERYTTGAKLVQVKTTNLGSLNRLRYDLRLRHAGTEKDMIDELRCRNGNLEITLARRSEDSEL
ncbi:MAG: DUF4956 domain-containing protein [Oscillospiraceae bacterium]|nr:DUF4956 domain-containing protein [Oscillospiraceae bacterium]